MENSTEKNFDTSTTGTSNTIDIKTEIDVDDYQYQLKQEPSEEDTLAKKRRLTEECQQTLIPKVERIEESDVDIKQEVTINDEDSANPPILRTILMQKQPVIQPILLPPPSDTENDTKEDVIGNESSNNALTNQQSENVNLNSTNVPTNEGEVQNLAGQSSSMFLNEAITLGPRYIGLYQRAFIEFEDKFTKNTFGHPCRVCDRLWFKDDLCVAGANHTEMLTKIVPDFFPEEPALLCSTCKYALDRNKIPIMATCKGYTYPQKPEYLPELDLVSERLVSPIIPFVQIRWLRREHEQFDIYGQVINIPASRSNMVQNLPRDVNDDHCFYVHIKNKIFYKSSRLRALINKQSIKMWLEYLVTTPLYEHYNIKMKQVFLQGGDEDVKMLFENVFEEIPADECLTAEHCSSTMLWNEEKFSKVAPIEGILPHSLVFDKYEEEFYFPSIYLGQKRKYVGDVTALSNTLVTSELRRTDRRGVTPCHLLYLAMKIMRQRVKECLAAAFRLLESDNNFTEEQLESEDFMNSFMQSNLAFMKCIPNSDWYWTDKKKDLFAILRQRGKPTAFMTLTANETGWPGLLQVLFKLKNHGAFITEEAAENLKFIKKCTLINEDAPTCVIYFDKLIQVLLQILRSRKHSPFLGYRLMDYFTRVEFHRGSPRVHILMWLENAPKDIFADNNRVIINFIEILSSASSSKALNHVRFQTHKHSSTCYEGIATNAEQKCQFGAPFMPCKKTVILEPLDPPTDDASKQFFEMCRSDYLKIKNNLENINYLNFDDFYKENSIESDWHYMNILRAGIDRVTIFLKREPREKWIQPFNPFILKVLGSHMDFQFITDDISCAECVAKCVSKINRGVSDLREKILETMKEHPEFGIAQITRKLSVDVLNSMEMTTQEAAWYLLREPLSKTSFKIIYLPTIPPNEREKFKNNQLPSCETDKDSTNFRKNNCIVQYEQRPEELEDLTLAKFHFCFYRKKGGNFAKRLEPYIIRYRNYDADTDIDNYKREMVTLYIPFRNEEKDIIADKRFIEIYNDNENFILDRRKEFESNFDMVKTLNICKELCRSNEKKRRSSSDKQ